MLRLAIALGGAAGALARHGVATMAAVYGLSGWPWATLLVNVAGSLALGILMATLPATTVSPAVRAGLTIGFCGGFTTFSTFASEAVVLARLGQSLQAAIYVAASLCLGLAGAIAGMQTGVLLTERRRRP